jgi:L-seryl-tRNA(Ser) seleniumtransferase
MEDQGSGVLVDLRRYGLPYEPTVAESISQGAAVVTCSGDKLLGGPQAGIAVGSHAAVERARKHPLMRALRPDKLTLAGLAATLALYREHRLDEIPGPRMLGTPATALRGIAEQLASSIGSVGGLTISVEPCSSTVGGGAMPTAQLPSWAVTLRGPSADELDRALRRSSIVGRIEDGRVWIDVRTLAPSELELVAAAVRALRP